MGLTRRAWLAASAAAAAGCAVPRASAASGTRWSFEPALAYDALMLAAPYRPAILPKQTDFTE